MHKKAKIGIFLKNSAVFLAMTLFHQMSVFGTNDNFYLRTIYENRTFETRASIVSKAPPEIILDIKKHLHRLEIDSLQWATEGLLSGDDESRNLLQAEFRNAEYCVSTGVLDVFVDIHFWRRVFENIQISVLKETGSDLYGNPFINLKLQNPNFFLRSAEGTLKIQETENSRQFVVLTSVRFAWFFSMFITTANFNSIAEWRIQTFLENLNEEANRR